ncbi:MAG: RnfABCDGE type electron transport complex subunit G [Clostridia bacterium]|nr:RnfABCDGE type electron transport complex subunit G [Clostridia bacterium]
MLNKETVLISLKLFIITAVAALCLAVVNKITTPIIAENNLAAEVKAQQEVLPDAADFTTVEIPVVKSDNVTIEKMTGGLQAENSSTIVGYVVTAVSNAGYGGDIKIMVGIDNNLKVTRIKILESSETAGLGANASKPEFARQFEGAADSLTVVKGAAKSGEISAIASATITSKAVTSCVNTALEAAKLKSTDSKVEETAQKLEQIKQETQSQISDGEGAAE